MKPLEILLAVIGALLVGWLLTDTYKSMRCTKPLTVDTVTCCQAVDTPINVKGKKVLFVGDSHSVYARGWQDRLTQRTGMIYKNTAQGGKHTTWMIRAAYQELDSTYKYCFIWGGANDMASQTPVKQAVHNIQTIVDMCNHYNVQPIVLTGFNPVTCIDITGKSKVWAPYPQRYIEFQQQLQERIHGAIIIKNHYISREDKDCSDFICHMSASGHRKMADSLIKACNFKTTD